MKKVLKKTLLVSSAVISFLILIILIASLIFFYKKSVIKGMLERYVADKTSVPIEIRNLDYELFPLRIEAQAIRVRTKIGETEVDVHLKRLNALGELKRLWKKTGPLFDSVEVEKAEVDVRIKMAGKKIDIQRLLLNLSQSSNFVRKINLRNSSLHLDFSSQKFFLQGLDISLLSAQQGKEYAYSIACKKLSSKMKNQEILLETSLRSSGVISLAELLYMEGHFSFKPFRVSLLEKSLSLDEILFKFSGEYPKGGDFLLFPQFELEVPALISLSSNIKANFKDNISIYLNPQIKANNVGALFALLFPYIPPSFKSLKVRGGALFKGEVQLFKRPSGREMSVDGQLSVDTLRIDFSNPLFSIRALAQGKFRIRSSSPAMEVSGHLKLSDGFFSTKNSKCEDFTLEAPVNFNMAQCSIKVFPLQANLGMLSITSKEKRIILKDVGLQAQSAFEIKRRIISVDDFALNIPSLFSVSGKAKADFSSAGTKMISLKGEKISLQNLLNTFPWFLPEELREWIMEGGFAFAMEAWNSPRNPDKEWTITGKLNMDGLNFSNPDFTVAGEFLSLRLKLDGSIDSGLQNIKFKLGFELPQGETLWREYYLNWSKIPLAGEMRGKFQTTLQELSSVQSEISLSSLGKISARGSLGLRPSLATDLLISISELDLQALFSLLLDSQVSHLSSLRLGGKLFSQTQLIKTKKVSSLKGSIQFIDGMVEYEKKKLILSGIEADIPFHYMNMMEGRPDKEGHKKEGYLHIKEAKLPFFDLSPFHLDLSSSGNEMLIKAFSLDVFEGEALFGDTVIHLGRKPSEITGLTSFILSDIDLSQLPLASDKLPLQGKLWLELPRVQVTPVLLDTEGQAKINIFEGNITITHMRVENPFSKMRTTSCDVNFSDINLQKFTDVLPFGRITGIINGEVSNLKFSFGQPESFVLRIESEPRKGIPKKFSLKAANDLAILSSGDQTLQPGKGWTRFISSFRYKRIGIFCSLKNDLFILRGTIKEKGVEYLVKGSWLFGINVINKKPENQIRFKDMLSRLKRIGRSKEFP